MLYGFILQTVPHHPAALHNMGMLHQQRGDKAKAIEYFCRATVAEPAQSKSKTLLGIAYSALGRVGEAADVYRRWLQEEPERSEEHTSELQSRENLVCRLLLETKDR